MSDRVRVALVCSECGARNYQTTKKQASSRTGPTERLELKKFCSHCDRHTLHRESK